MEDRNLSLTEVAGLMGVSERTVRRWIKAGKLRAYKPGRDYRIPESAVRVFVEESEISPKAIAPPSPQPSFNGLLEEERREAAYEPWLQFVNRYADRWDARIEAGDLDLGSINEFARMLDELLPTLAELEKRERREVPTAEWEDLKINQAISRLMTLFNPLLAAAASKFESSELEQVRRKRAELDKQIAEAG
jgi:excisionase family DNA binding protein